MTAARNRLIQRLDDGEVVLIDGEMVTGLMSSVAKAFSPDKDINDQMDDVVMRIALANVEHPDIVRGLHREYIDAGAEVILANTFINGLVDMQAGHEAEHFEETNRLGIELAIAARDEADRPDVAVAGAIACTTHLGPRIGTYARQAQIHADAGADLIAIEMIGTRDEGEDAIRAVRSVGLPVWVGVSAVRRPDGTLITEAGHPTDKEQSWARGEDLREVLSAFAAMDINALTIMHTAIEDTDEALEIAKEVFDGPIGAYPHQGDFGSVHEWRLDPVSPADFAAAALRWVDAGAHIVGGCCGIGPKHIAATRDALGTRTAR